MKRRHRAQGSEDEILHHFDVKERVLRILFVDRKGGLTPVTYRLCGTCGVAMERTESIDEITWSCTFCGFEVAGG